MAEEFTFNALGSALNVTNGIRANIPFPTSGDEYMWITLARNNGWVLQQDIITKHCRILDSNNVRRAWGTHSAMEWLFRRMSENG